MTAQIPIEQSYRRIHPGLRIHWIVFLSVNAFLFFINLVTSYQVVWHLYPLLSWGIGIGIHTAVVRVCDATPSGGERGVAIHGWVTVILVAYFLCLDLLTGSWISWFMFPSIPLVAAWLIHFVAHYQAVQSQRGTPVNGFYVLLYPGIVCLMLAAFDFVTSPWDMWFYWPAIPIMCIGLIVAAALSGKRPHTHIYPPVAPQPSVQPIASEPQVQPTGLFCPNCGQSNKFGNLFCEYCGQPLKRS